MEQKKLIAISKPDSAPATWHILVRIAMNALLDITVIQSVDLATAKERELVALVMCVSVMNMVIVHVRSVSFYLLIETQSYTYLI